MQRFDEGGVNAVVAFLEKEIAERFAERIGAVEKTLRESQLRNIAMSEVSGNLRAQIAAAEQTNTELGRGQQFLHVKLAAAEKQCLIFNGIITELEAQIANLQQRNTNQASTIERQDRKIHALKILVDKFLGPGAVSDALNNPEKIINGGK